MRPILAALAACLLASCGCEGARSLQAVEPQTPVKRFDWRVSIGKGAPDCYYRDVILVNGKLQPTIEVEQFDTLEVLLRNEIPEDYPDVTGGLSLHFHGLAQKGTPWYDGPVYATQCPVRSGGNFTYRFQVSDPPGTYFWHSHSGAMRVDGLAGPLIVRPRGGGSGVPAGQPKVSAEHTVMLQDWYHSTGAALSMRLNRPFDAANQTVATGGWGWADNAQSILLNGRGFYQDCALGPGGNTKNVNCSVTANVVAPGRSPEQPWAPATSPGCEHYNLTVRAGETYLIRLINAATLSYQTVCFGSHNVTIIAADARPVVPLEVACVDINAGQRYDVLLTSDQAPGNYWISSSVQFRPGSPSGYGILRYEGFNATSLPATPVPQPGSVQPWPDSLEAALRSPKPANLAGEADVKLALNLTQPLQPQSGQLTWAINNVAHTEGPPCQPLLQLFKQEGWLAQHTVGAAQFNAPGFSSDALGVQTGPASSAMVFVTTPNSTHPVYPTVGTHIIPLRLGDVVELVLFNLPANSNNGDLRPSGASRNATEQHPFHLHGHHFALLGTGQVPYNEAAKASLNRVDPPLRDTATLPKGGWMVLRFTADNPGAWLLHCHILWHQFMGQLLTFVVAPDMVAPPPADYPACPANCTYNRAPWTKPYVQEQYGATGYDIPN